MLRLPAGADYSLLAMVHLAASYRSGELVKAAGIADAQSVPLSFLERLLGQLRAAGLVGSTRGPGGGHRLSRPPGSITAGEVLEVILGPGATGGCLGFLWQRCEGALNDALSISLAELADELKREQDVAEYQI